MSASIRHGTSAHDVALARGLFLEYAEWLQVDLCFQGFEQELATLPGAYAPPHGRLLLAGEPADAFGCIALRPIDDDAVEADWAIGEVKRLYVQPSHRRGGWGNRLVEAVVEQARAIGYGELKLDTLESMDASRSLYAAHGFTPCAPYYVNPLPGVVYMARRL